MVDLKKLWPGGGVSGQPENPPGYATGPTKRALRALRAFVSEVIMVF